MATGGDDVMKKAGLSLSHRYLLFQKMDPSKDKRYVSRRGDFCSFIIINGRIYKDPVILFKRLIAQLERGNGENVALGYFDMFAINYRQGDHIVEDLSANEQMYISAVNRIMFNLKRLYGVKTHIPWENLNITEEYERELDQEGLEKDLLKNEEMWENALEPTVIDDTTLMQEMLQGGSYQKLADELSTYMDDYTSFE